METTPETRVLLEELYDRAAIVSELDGPQLEAWVSGLFPLFDDQVSVEDFVDFCARQQSVQGALVIAAIAELAAGVDPAVAAHARDRCRDDLLPGWAGGIGASHAIAAWRVSAPFGQSIVLGFDAADRTSPAPIDSNAGTGTAIDDAESVDLRHSILFELGADGALADLQLAGPPRQLVQEASAADDRVSVAQLDVDDAVAAVVTAWPTGRVAEAEMGPGFDANQQFVRRRIQVLSGDVLPQVKVADVAVDIARGLGADDYASANRAARSTLQAAVGLPEATASASLTPMVEAWAAVIRGDIANVSARERDALLWLEWADWLGAGIGLIRGGVGAPADGEKLVDYVNRCPEVSSSIDKADRDYAAWAFAVALDLLQDAGVITEDAQLSADGHASLKHGLLAAWT